MGTSSGTRLLSCSSSKPTGSRDGSGVNSACDSSGTTARASFPRAARSARLSCSPVPARAESPPDLRGPALRRAASSVFTVMMSHLPPGPVYVPFTVRSPFDSTARKGELHPLDGVNPVVHLPSRPPTEEPGGGKYLHQGDARGSHAVHDDDQEPSEVGDVSDGGRRGADCTSRNSSATLRSLPWSMTLTRCGGWAGRRWLNFRSTSMCPTQARSARNCSGSSTVAPPR